MVQDQLLAVLTPGLIAELAAMPLERAARPQLGMDNVRSGVVTHATGEWLVCRAPQNPGCARLLDVVVALRGHRNLPCLAILEPPADKGRKLEAKPEYRSAYQGSAWHALRVALVLDEGERSFSPVDARPPDAARTSFDALVVEIESALRDDALTVADGTRWMIPEDSREAEALVRLTMNRVLRPNGYRRHVEDASALGKTYKGFWRGAEADGLWTCEKAPVRHLALESKLNEDLEAPLCQIVDHLAWVTSGGGSGGVLYVRVHRKGRTPAPRTDAMKQLEKTLLVRYLDVILDA